LRLTGIQILGFQSGQTVIQFLRGVVLTDHRGGLFVDDSRAFSLRSDHKFRNFNGGRLTRNHKLQRLILYTKGKGSVVHFFDETLNRLLKKSALDAVMRT
jgi:hypothetical protein